MLLVNSGRAAIEIILGEVKSRTQAREVILPSFICRSVPDKVVGCGFRPVFFDVDRHLVPDAGAAAALITPGTAAVLFPYLYGRVADISARGFVLGAPRWGDDHARAPWNSPSAAPVKLLPVEESPSPGPVRHLRAGH